MYSVIKGKNSRKQILTIEAIELEAALGNSRNESDPVQKLEVL